jgi:hypothetical protein
MIRHELFSFSCIWHLIVINSKTVSSVGFVPDMCNPSVLIFILKVFSMYTANCMLVILGCYTVSCTGRKENYNIDRYRIHNGKNLAGWCRGNPVNFIWEVHNHSHIISM